MKSIKASKEALRKRLRGRERIENEKKENRRL